MMIVLDYQHQGRASHPGDTGAHFGALRETELTGAYIESARTFGHSRGHVVEVLAAGEYGTRQARAIAIADGHLGPVAYVACHVNAGGGRYALVEYDHRSSGGLALARALVDPFDHLGAYVESCHVEALAPEVRGFVCLSGIYAGPPNLSAVLVEPGFIDQEAHAPLWTPAGLARIGVAIVVGCESWAATRGVR